MSTSSKPNKLDDAARAGWLYYIAGNTQDEIARKMDISRPSAQRLVSLAVTEGLVKMRLDHPISECMALAANLAARFELKFCEVVPSDPAFPYGISGIAQSAASQIEKVLMSAEPKILAFGTGRTLRAAAEELSPMKCPQHSLISLLGNIMPDGSATAYNVIIRLAEKANARHYPMPIPPVARTIEERQMFREQEPVTNILQLASRADVTFVGVGEIGDECPMHIDGFISHEEVRELMSAGAVGEITSWCYDKNGNLISGLVNDRVTNAPLKIDSANLVCGVAAGKAKVLAIRAALDGKLLNGLITNEATAQALLIR